MITKRIIPCLDIKDGRVVKGIQFSSLKDVASPVELAAYYSNSGADELVFYDITASFEGRALFTDILRSVASQIFIPLTVGGGINTINDFERVLSNGADKVSINTGAVKNPRIIEEGAKKYGSQCVILSMDVSYNKDLDKYEVYTKGGRERTDINAIEWAKQGEAMGAGELVINSIDTDGVKGGFDLPLLQKICESVNIPVIASGGAGSISHFTQLFKELPTVDAGLAASVFHFGQIEIKDLKAELSKNNINVRII